MRPGNKGPAAEHIDRSQVVRFDHAAGFVHHAAQGLEIAFRLEKRLGGNDDFLARIGEIAGQSDPVGDAQLLPARTDHFAYIEGFQDLVLGHFRIKLEDLIFGPEEE